MPLSNGHRQQLKTCGNQAQRRTSLLSDCPWLLVPAEIVMAGEEALRSVYTDLIYRDQLVRGERARAGGARGGSVLTC